MWTLPEAERYLAEAILPKLAGSGWTARIVGGVRNKGFSTHDLDILVRVVDLDSEDVIDDPRPLLGIEADCRDPWMESIRAIASAPGGKMVDYFFSHDGVWR